MGFDLTTTAGAGMDDVKTSESMPMLKILQDLSAEVKESHPDHETKKIEGAKAGSIVYKNSVLMPEKFQVIPVAQDTAYVEWKPKSEGGGIVGSHGPEVLAHPDFKKGEGANKWKMFLGNNELKETTYVLVKVDIDGAWETGIIAFSGGFFNALRTWNTQITNFRYTDKNLKDIAPPMFARKYEVTKDIASNKAGETYYTWKFVPADGGILDPNKDEALLSDCNDLFTTREGALPSPEVKQLTDSDSDPF